MGYIDEEDATRTRGCKPRRGVPGLCANCGEIVYRMPSLSKARNFYCSRLCHAQYLSKNANYSICPVCGVIFHLPKAWVKHRNIKCCSMKCKGIYASEHFQGEKSPSWRGGASKEYHRIRNGKKFREWRKAVFTRDKFTCQACGVVGGYLHPHHIYPFTGYTEKRFEVSNGVTLCKVCHYFVHFTSPKRRPWEIPSDAIWVF
jgi:5-methylcytosine-specific restriction endonuclease McrA